ncbi:MAG: type II secretion system protein [Clostridium sp.]|uniref:type II secretion system protein n=1 Tax=Clostridium sp. TaxID=1506 RepID=UPI002FCC1812
MIKTLKKRKKKGFTLIELIAVIAIIGILAAVLVPKVFGYMQDAKRSKVIAQSRSVLMAYEAYNAKVTVPLAAPANCEVSDVKKGIADENLTEYADLDGIDMIADTVTLDKLKEATDGKKEVVIGEGGIWTGTFKEDSTGGSEK